MYTLLFVGGGRMVVAEEEQEPSSCGLLPRRVIRQQEILGQLVKNQIFSGLKKSSSDGELARAANKLDHPQICCFFLM